MMKTWNSRNSGIEKESVENLPKQWSEDFHLSHLNMAFDEPVKIRLKITRVREKADYTFLHDWFGDTFRFVERVILWR